MISKEEMLECLKDWKGACEAPDCANQCSEEMFLKCQESYKAIRRLIENGPEVDFNSWFYKNCKRQRKAGAKICQVCPFRKNIEQQEAGVRIKEEK